MALIVLALLVSVYGAVVSGREAASQAPLRSMVEGLELLAVERDVSLAAHEFVTALAMEMYQGGHGAVVERARESFRQVAAEAAAHLAADPPSDGWRSTRDQMERALRSILPLLVPTADAGRMLAQVDEFLYDFKRVVPSDNVGDRAALLEVATWAPEVPLVVRDYLETAMAREWELSGRAPADPELVAEYQAILAYWRQIRQSHDDPAEFSPFEEYILTERARAADSVAHRLVAEMAAHPAVRQIENDTPFMLGFTDEPSFGSVGEIYRLREAWVPSLARLGEALRRHAVATLSADLEASRRRGAVARFGAALAVTIGILFGLRLVRQRLRLDGELRRALERDVLTGLGNRYALFASGPATVANRDLASFALIHMDLDDFKSINDDHGHHIGDLALKHFAEALRSAVRSPADLVCRIGGDEFVILLHGLKDPVSEVSAVVHRLKGRLEETVVLDGVPLRLHFTAGVAVSPDPADLQDLLVEADLALLEAKERGRDVAQFFRRRMGRRMVEELSTALDSGELRCAFQPQIDLRTGRLVGLEALARWHREDRLSVPARSLVEALAWLGASTQWLESMMRDAAAAWPIVEPHLEGRIWLNLMRSDIEETSADDLLRILSASPVPLDRVGVELTDPVGRAQLADVADRLEAIRSAGVAVALDNVGDDRVPLLHLTELPIDCVKLDRCVVEKIDSRPPFRTIVRSLVELCDRLDRRVVAEGVETEAERAVLHRLGVRYAQGFLFARPLPVSALPGYFESRRSARSGGGAA